MEERGRVRKSPEEHTGHEGKIDLTHWAELVENIGVHYAKTLRVWRENWLSQRDKILKLGFDETFIRKVIEWLYLLDPDWLFPVGILLCIL